jgi:predicted flap endonuclease-1-like 5' DNA nuclease
MAKGIKTFGQLADSKIEDIQAILDEAKIRIANPTTWAEQAKLAAKGDWDSLAKLQENLKGGRREPK